MPTTEDRNAATAALPTHFRAIKPRLPDSNSHAGYETAYVMTVAVLFGTPILRQTSQRNDFVPLSVARAKHPSTAELPASEWLWLPTNQLTWDLSTARALTLFLSRFRCKTWNACVLYSILRSGALE